MACAYRQSERVRFPDDSGVRALTLRTSNKNPGLSDLGRVPQVPRPFSDLFNVAASRPAQLTTGQLVPNKPRRFPSRPRLDRSSRDMTLPFNAGDQGILPDRLIHALAASGAIPAAQPFVPGQVQPASLDLRLGAVAYRVRASFLPGPGTSVEKRIAELKLHQIDLRDGAVLETGCVYIVPLMESLALPLEIAASANPKSSTGRLDVFTRVIADETRGFDRIEAGYHGPLYAEISPRTFPVLVRTGSRLSQIRFRRGAATLDAKALRNLHASERLVDDDNADVSEGVAVGVDLAGFGSVIGYRAKRHTGLIDVDQRT